jgi:hypothetical protein
MRRFRKPVGWKRSREFESPPLRPGLGTAVAPALSAGMTNSHEGWFAIPQWRKIAPTYNEAVQIVLAKLSETRKGKFYNYRSDEMGPANLREGSRKVSYMQQLAEGQNDADILIVPAQFGLTHRGRSVRRAREVFKSNEFGLGAFEVGIMLLTHPERLANYDDLWIDCAGDEFKPSDESEFSSAPFFGFSDDGLGFGTSWFSNAFEHFGSASAFLPQ